MATDAPAPETSLPPQADSPEIIEVPRDWTMIVIMLTIIAALGFGGTAMMFRRAEASKLQAEAAMAQAREARDEAERARKDALAQTRLAEQLRAQLAQATGAEADARLRAAAAEIPPPVLPAPSRPAETGPALSTVSTRQFGPTEETMPIPRADMRRVLDSAAQELESGKYKSSPASEAAIHSTLGRTYLSLGDRDRAAQHLQRAVELRSAVAGEKDPQVIKDREALEQARRPLR